jgi:thiamine pyrophosphokinase
VTLVRDGEIAFPPEAEGIISVFCMGKDANGVTIAGLQYGLTDGTLSAGFPLGVSNHFVGQRATVSVRNGSLMLLWDRANGFPVCRTDL